MNKKILVIGEPLIRFTFSDQTLSDKEAQKLDINIGGDVLNVGALLANSDYDVELLTQIPTPQNNVFSYKVLKHCDLFKIKTHHVLFDNKRMGTYFYTPANELKPANVIYDRAYSSYTNLTFPFKDTQQIFTGLKLIHLSGISIYPSHQFREQLLEFLLLAKEQGIKISLDLNFRSKLWASYGEFKTAIEPFVKLANICFGWLSETNDFKPLNAQQYKADVLQDLTNNFVTQFPNLELIASPLRNNISLAKNTVEGFARFNNQIFVSKVVSFKPYYPIGAGDSFVGGFLSQYLAKKELMNCLDFATNSYAIKHLYSGDVNLASPQEIKEFNSNQSQKINR